MKVERWGNSLAVRFSDAIAQALDIQEGDDIHFRVEAGKVFIETKLPQEEMIRRLKALRIAERDANTHRTESH